MKDFIIHGKLVLLIILLHSCASMKPTKMAQNTKFEQAEKFPKNSKSSIIIFNFKPRSYTSIIEDGEHFLNVYFKRLDKNYLKRKDGDFDFSYEYATSFMTSHGWDEKYKPKVYKIQPGKYVIEKFITYTSPNYQSGLKGYNPKYKIIPYGFFEVRAGEVINLGELQTRTNIRLGAYEMKIKNNHKSIMKFIKRSYPQLASRLKLKKIKVNNTYAPVIRKGEFSYLQNEDEIYKNSLQK